MQTEQTTAETINEEATTGTTETEAPAEGAPANQDADATQEGDEAAPADNSNAEPEEGDEQPESEGKRKRGGGYLRKIERLERELQVRDALLAQTYRPPQPQGDDKPKDPAAQMEEYVQNIVAQRMAAEREQQRQAKVQADFQKRTQEVRAANPDFDEVLAASDAPVSQAVQQALLTSEHGPAIMYQLAKNPAELARISALPPLDAAREIGRLEAKASVVATPKANPKPAVTRKPAPAPITPVTARGPTNVKPVEQMSYEEYSAWRESQRKR